MLGEFGLELIVIFALTLLNGFFSASEIAIVSARRSRLEALAKEGSHAAQQALDLAAQPDRFLGTVQVGISLIATFSAAFGGARISSVVADWMETIPAFAPHADALSLLLVVLGLTYLSLVVGELVPKRLALQNAESVALRAAPVIVLIARILRPFVAFLSVSVRAVLRLFGRNEVTGTTVTQEDILFMLREGSESGAVEPSAAALIQQAFRFSDRPVRSVMTPRTEIIAVGLDTTLDEIARVFTSSKYSRLPVYREKIDHVVGILHAKSFIRLLNRRDEASRLTDILLPAEFVLEGEPVDQVMERALHKGFHMAIVLDEYGGTAGLITLEDMLEELVGEIRDEYDQEEKNPIVQRDDGSWLVDGLTDIARLRDFIDLPGLPELGASGYDTLGGMIMALVGRIPEEADVVSVGDWLFEVLDMDERRVDKVLIRHAPPAEDLPDTQPDHSPSDSLNS